MNCFTCGKHIDNQYNLNGKIYGYQCYKMALSLYLAKMEELKNDEYSRKCIALIEVFSQKSFKDKWNNDFKNSILNQWNECKKLTIKQFDCIYDKFSDDEKINCGLTFYEINKEYPICEKPAGKNLLFTVGHLSLDQLNTFKHDERLHDYIKTQNARSINKGIKYYIVNYKDVDDNEIYCILLKDKDYESYKEDEYIKILDVVEII